MMVFKFITTSEERVGVSFTLTQRPSAVVTKGLIPHVPLGAGLALRLIPFIFSFFQKLSCFNMIVFEKGSLNIRVKNSCYKWQESSHFLLKI